MHFAVVNLPLFAAACDRLGLADELASAIARQPPGVWVDIARAYAVKDFVAAAEMLRLVGSKADEAEARMRAAEHLALSGRAGEAEEQRRQAFDFYDLVGASYFAGRSAKAGVWAGVSRPAEARRASALSTRSQVKSWSSRPK